MTDNASLSLGSHIGLPMHVTVALERESYCESLATEPDARLLFGEWSAAGRRG